MLTFAILVLLGVVVLAVAWPLLFPAPVPRRYVGKLRRHG
jgi:hypothetical protein